LAHIGERSLAPPRTEFPLQQEIRRFTLEARLAHGGDRHYAELCL
jgi:hypothetical protein